MAYSILIPKDLNNELTALSKLEGRPKSYLIKAAIKNYLPEQKEDRQDAEIALARKNDTNDKIYTSKEADEFLKKIYDL
ncbi:MULTISPECIES: hypothetical protein [unclassified Rickettsia]|uniref:hypothetical protein n=1 Tax=unclassified Rickettsia TaxID=114295 RepID=UPI00209E687E|nr:hypothetical protein [Rickettsia endosymbiont of Ceutorhynchus assimilis]